MALGNGAKIGLGVAALIAGVVLIVVRMPRDQAPTQRHKVYLADVETGELFVFDTSNRRAAVIPELHPQTKEPRLWPVEKGPDGSWSIESRFLAEIRETGRKTPAMGPNGVVKTAYDVPKAAKFVTDY